MYFMRADAHKVGAFPKAGRDLGKRLYRIGVKERVRAKRLDKPCKRRNVVDRAGLVVDRHDGHQNRVGRKGRTRLIEVDLAAFRR